MHFLRSKKRLEKKFEEYDILNIQKHSQNYVVSELSNGSKISICFPGYKRKPRKPDYRVDIIKNDRRCTLSHVNIIVDIYNKFLNGFSPIILNKILIDLFQEGEFNIKAYPEILTYKKNKPSNELLNYIKKLDANYDSGGNQWDLEFEELFHSIKWIALQEDINYPIGRYQGRKMPLARYIEALWYCENIFLFKWDKIPGKDSEKLIKFLETKFKVNLIKPDIKKKDTTLEVIDGEKTERRFILNLKNEKNRVELILNGKIYNFYNLGEVIKRAIIKNTGIPSNWEYLDYSFLRKIT